MKFQSGIGRCTTHLYGFGSEENRLDQKRRKEKIEKMMLGIYVTSKNTRNLH